MDQCGDSMTGLGKTIFATLFPNCGNMELTKDVGMIPYVLHRDYGYDSYVICYDNGPYPRLTSEVPGLKMILMNRIYIPFATGLARRAYELQSATMSKMARGFELLQDCVSVIPFFLKYAKHIDVLQLYHLGLKSHVTALLYRVMNKEGIVYLKLDMNPAAATDFYEKHLRGPRGVLARLAAYDFVSAETYLLYRFLKRKGRIFKILCHVPNGIDPVISRHVSRYEEREPLILHVGRDRSFRKSLGDHPRYVCGACS